MRTTALAHATLATFGCLALACATSPTGRRQLTLLPDSQMDAMGQTAFQEMKAREAVSGDPRAQEYAQCVAQQIVEANRGRLDDATWEVVVFDEPDTVNAFALPGGKIGIYTGMLRFAEGDDQLAAVVGHEVAHVLAEHGNERVSTALAAQGLLGAVSAGWESDSTAKALVLGGLGVGFDLGVARPHSRTQETEADRIGLIMMASAGFDPRAAVDLWRRMDAQNPAAPPEILSTHPSSASRVLDLSQLLAEAVPVFERARAEGRTPACDHAYQLSLALGPRFARR